MLASQPGAVPLPTAYALCPEYIIFTAVSYVNMLLFRKETEHRKIVLSKKQTSSEWQLRIETQAF